MSARLSLASPAGSLQKSALRKELINQPDFVFTSLRPTNKFVCVVLQKQKDADKIDISLLRFDFAKKGIRPAAAAESRPKWGCCNQRLLDLENVVAKIYF